jgi:putative FmdB family regulatory protein
MPLYEYGPASENTADTPNPCCSFEVLQKHNEPALTQCPTCGSAIKKLISRFGFSASSTNAPNQNTGVRENSTAIANPVSPSNTPAGRAIQHSLKHVCRVGCGCSR